MDIGTRCGTALHRIDDAGIGRDEVIGGMSERKKQVPEATGNFLKNCAPFISTIHLPFPRSDDDMNSTPICVFGAGVIGLFTAYDLLKHGFTNVTVLAECFEELASHNAGSHGDNKCKKFKINIFILYRRPSHTHVFGIG